MINTNVFLLCTLCLVLEIKSAVGTPSAPLGEADLRKILAQKCDEVNAFYRAEHFTVLATSPEKCGFRLETDTDYKEQIADFNQTDQAVLQGILLSSSGRIIKFRNYAAVNANDNLPPEEGLPPPKWTKEHAIEIADKFAKIFLRSWNVHLAEPTADFTWPLKTETMAKPGRWTVVWNRVSESGVRLYGDAVVVTESEGYGPATIALFLALHDDGKKFTPISKDRALTEAKKGLAQILAWKSAKDWLPNSETTEGPSIPELLMVQPNADLKGDFDRSLDSLVPRPAWVIYYSVRSKTDPSFKGTVQIYIDAQDGSFLGGTF